METVIQSVDLDAFLSAIDAAEAQPADGGLLDDVFNEPYRSRCNTWPRMPPDLSSDSRERQQGHLQQSLWDASPPPTTQTSPESAYSPSTGPLPLVSEEEDAGAQPRQTKQPEPEAIVHAAHTGSRRNPWGNQSYADLITHAIQSSPDKRLTLAQIYDWLIKNIPHFREKSDNVSSIGWKVSSGHL